MAICLVKSGEIRSSGWWFSINGALTGFGQGGSSFIVGGVPCDGVSASPWLRDECANGKAGEAELCCTVVVMMSYRKYIWKPILSHFYNIVAMIPRMDSLWQFDVPSGR